MWQIFKIKTLIYYSKANLDCVRSIPAHFENGEKCVGLYATVFSFATVHNATVFSFATVHNATVFSFDCP